MNKNPLSSVSAYLLLVLQEVVDEIHAFFLVLSLSLVDTLPELLNFVGSLLVFAQTNVKYVLASFCNM